MSYYVIADNDCFEGREIYGVTTDPVKAELVKLMHTTEYSTPVIEVYEEPDVGDYDPDNVIWRVELDYNGTAKHAERAYCTGTVIEHNRIICAYIRTHVKDDSMTGFHMPYISTVINILAADESEAKQIAERVRREYLAEHPTCRGEEWVNPNWVVRGKR